MFNQLPGRKLTVGRELLGGRGEIFNHGLLLFAQVGVAQLGPNFFRFYLAKTSVDRNARDPVLERYLAGKLVQLLKNFNENHLAKILFTSSSGSMGADHLRDKWEQAAHQLASRFIIVPLGSLNQLSSVEISHVVVEIVSTLLRKTGVAIWRLQVSV